MTEVRRIDTRTELIGLARELGVRPDWHEPDEQEVTAQVHGANFDNAGFWGTSELAHRARLNTQGIEFSDASLEMWVTLYRDNVPVAEINLATLFALAAGPQPPSDPLDTARGEVRAASNETARELDKLANELRNRASHLRDLADTF